MSTTIRVSKEDKRRLMNFAKRRNAASMTEAFRIALTLAENKDDDFMGNVNALRETLRHAGSRGTRISENVDEELARAIAVESER